MISGYEALREPHWEDFLPFRIRVSSTTRSLPSFGSWRKDLEARLDTLLLLLGEPLVETLTTHAELCLQWTFYDRVLSLLLFYYHMRSNLVCQQTQFVTFGKAALRSQSVFRGRMQYLFSKK